MRFMIFADDGIPLGGMLDQFRSTDTWAQVVQSIVDLVQAMSFSCYHAYDAREGCLIGFGEYHEGHWNHYGRLAEDVKAATLERQLSC